MAEFTISIDACLGYHCNGSGEYAEGEGTVELDDWMVDALVMLIRENDWETDVEELQLEQRLPEVYARLQDAYSDLADTIEYRNWATVGFLDNHFDEPDGLMEQLEEDGLFIFDLEKYKEENPLDGDEEYDEDELEDAKAEAFEDWLFEYTRSLGEDELLSFLESYYWEALDDYEPFGLNYEILIPDEIILMADKED